jgi:hypothetical protein
MTLRVYRLEPGNVVWRILVVNAKGETNHCEAVVTYLNMGLLSCSPPEGLRERHEPVHKPQNLIQMGTFLLKVNTRKDICRIGVFTVVRAGNLNAQLNIYNTDHSFTCAS